MAARSTQNVPDKYSVAMSFGSVTSFPTELINVVLKVTKISRRKIKSMIEFKVLKAAEFIYYGSNATLKGIVKQLKIADSMIRISHLDLKLSFCLNMNFSTCFSAI